MRREAKRLAPDSLDDAIRKNIGSKVKKNENDGRQELKVGLFSSSTSSKRGKPPAPHSHLVHNGTESRFHKKGKYVGEMPENPFILFAIEGSVSTIKEIQSKYLSEMQSENPGGIDEKEDIGDD